jgi:hypothetical protein
MGDHAAQATTFALPILLLAKPWGYWHTTSKHSYLVFATCSGVKASWTHHLKILDALRPSAISAVAERIQVSESREPL